MSEHCKDCKYWAKVKDYKYPKTFDIGKCKRVPEFWRCSEVSHCEKVFGAESIYHRAPTAKAEDCLAFVQDGEDYSAEFLTLPDFGCVQFEEEV